MYLANYISKSRVFVWCEKHDLEMLPLALHITDAQTGWYLVEFPLGKETEVALQLCGLSIKRKVNEY